MEDDGILENVLSSLRQGQVPTVNLIVYYSIILKQKTLTYKFYRYTTSTDSGYKHILSSNLFIYWLKALNEEEDKTKDNIDSISILIQLLDHELSKPSAKESGEFAISLLKSGIFTNVLIAMKHYGQHPNVLIASLSVIILMLTSLPLSYKTLMDANVTIICNLVSKTHSSDIMIQSLICNVFERMIVTGGITAFNAIYYDSDSLTNLVSFFFNRTGDIRDKILFYNGQIHFLHLCLIAASYSEKLCKDILLPYDSVIQSIWTRPAFTFNCPERMVSANDTFVGLIQRKYFQITFLYYV